MLESPKEKTPLGYFSHWVYHLDKLIYSNCPILRDDRSSVRTWGPCRYQWSQSSRNCLSVTRDGCVVKNDNMPFGNLFACGTCVMAKTAGFSAPFDLCLFFTRRDGLWSQKPRLEEFQSQHMEEFERMQRHFQWHGSDGNGETVGISNLQGVLGQSSWDRGYWQFVKASLNTKKGGWA